MPRPIHRADRPPRTADVEIRAHDRTAISWLRRVGIRWNHLDIPSLGECARVTSLPRSFRRLPVPWRHPADVAQRNHRIADDDLSTMSSFIRNANIWSTFTGITVVSLDAAYAPRHRFESEPFLEGRTLDCPTPVRRWTILLPKAHGPRRPRCRRSARSGWWPLATPWHPGSRPHRSR